MNVKAQSADDYFEFNASRKYRHFSADPLSALKGTVARFFNCQVEFISTPLRVMRDRWEVDLLKNPRRGCYILNDSEALVVGRVLGEKKKLLSAFCLHLTGGRFNSIPRLLNVFEGALTLTVTKSHRVGFEDASQRLGDELARLTIAKQFSKGVFDYRRFLYLISFFEKLAGTTFEGRAFTTGLILTRSHYAFAGKEKGSRFGTAYQLENPQQLTFREAPQRRFWYLVDGTSTFFLCDRRLRIGTLFVLNDATSNPETFLGSYALSKTLRGGDALFRVSAPSEFSITEPAGLEFVYKDNSWRVRDFPRLNEALQQSAGLSTDAAAALLFWVSDLSRRRQSALIWLPAAGIETSESLISQNALTKTGLSLRKPTHIATIARVLTSDGATIIDNEMNVRAYGCIVDSSKAKVSGVRGTGESVASYLGARGLAIKISQDGGVKVFPAPGVPPILL